MNLRTNLKHLRSVGIPLLGWALLSSFGAAEIPQDTIAISEIVVTGAREQIDLRHLPMSVSVVDSTKIMDRREQSILPVLNEQVPSLFITSRGIMGYGVSTGSSGGMKMRGIGGSPTTGVLILIDGHPQYMGLMGHPIADAYQSYMTQKVEVVRGPASVLYGSNAMGGVINILTEKETEDGMAHNLDLGYGSFNSFTSQYNNSFRKDKFSSSISGSYNNSEGHRENMDFEQYGGFAKVGYDFSDVLKVSADLSLTHFNASNPGTIYAPVYDNDSRITRLMSSVSLDNDFGNTSGSLKLFYNWGEHNINDGYYDGGTPAEYYFLSNDNMIGVNLYQSVSLFEGNRLTLGADYQHFGGLANNVYYSDESESQLVDESEDTYAGYLDFRQNLSNFITLDAGVRYDYSTATGGHVIPQFGASIYPSNTGTLKLIASRGFRNPTIKEMYMFVSQNPDLEPESLWNYEISWKSHALRGRLGYELNLFYIDGENMIETVYLDGKMTNVNTGEIKNLGFELAASYALSNKFMLSSNYSYLDMENPVLAAPEHKFFAGLDFNCGRFSASAGVQFVDGLYTSISDEANLTESFTMVNLRASYRFSDKFQVYVKGENLLDQDYQINYGYTMPGASVMCGLSLKL